MRISNKILSLIFFLLLLIGATAKADNLPSVPAKDKDYVAWNASVIRSDTTIVIKPHPENVKTAVYINMLGTLTVASGNTLTIEVDPEYKGNVVFRTSTNTNFTNGFNGIKTFTDKNGIETLTTSSMFKVEEGGSLIMNGPSNTSYYMAIRGRYSSTGIQLTPHGSNNQTMSDGQYLESVDVPVYNDLKRNIDFQDGLISAIGNLTLYNVRISDVWTDSPGGAICVPQISTLPTSTKYGQITLRKCRIERCRAQRGPALMICNQIGYNNDGSISTGSANTSSSCSVTLDDVLIRWCYATDSTNGGIIRTYGNTVASINLKKTTISQCATPSKGGAIYWNGHGRDDTEIIFNGCKFNHNKAVGNGGALVLEGSFEFKDSLTEIYGNVSGGIGAGACVQTYDLAVASVLKSLDMNFNKWVKIYGNTALKGGGIGFNLLDTTLPKGATLNVNIDGADISSNTAQTSGGGIYYHCAIPTTRGFNVAFNMDGDSVIDGNTATSDGGGIYFEVKEGTTVPVINFNQGRISQNTSTNGAGAYIRSLDVKCTDTSKGLVLDSNVASDCGGALYIYNGSMEMSGGTIKSNRCKAYGGGVYIKDGHFDLSGGSIIDNIAALEDVDIEQSGHEGGAIYCWASEADPEGTYSIVLTGGVLRGNKANNGGAIYVTRGNILCDLLSDGEGVLFENNYANNVGGALAIYSGASMTVNGGQFLANHTNNNGGAIYMNSPAGNMNLNGGQFSKNNCMSAGGAIYVYAADKCDVNDVKILDNSACNGGGMYIAGGAEMTFGNGMIMRNSARIDPANNGNNSISFTSARGTVTSLKGVGGGVFLGPGESGKPTTLIFDGTGDFGLYSNLADIAADDIYASGDNTSITLPDIAQMSLKNYKTKTSELFWVEDYMTGDTDYHQYGTNVNPDTSFKTIRYRTSNSSQMPVYKVTSREPITKFTCLSLGYEIIFATIVRSGLIKGENAIYQISRFDADTEKWIVYSQIMLFGPADATAANASSRSVSKRIALFSGKWKVEELDWAWTYQGNSVVERSITGESPSSDKVFLFQRTKATEDALSPKQYSESAVSNDFGSGTVVVGPSSSASSSDFEKITENGVRW